LNNEKHERARKTLASRLLQDSTGFKNFPLLTFVLPRTYADFFRLTTKKKNLVHSSTQIKKDKKLKSLQLITYYLKLMQPQITRITLIKNQEYKKNII